jgi:hypothetical protein
VQTVNSLLHHLIWQRLPRDLRRQALLQTTRLIAPRPTPEVKAGLPIIVAGALRTASRLGESARFCHDALRSASLPVHGLNLSRDLLQPEDFPCFQFSAAAYWGRAPSFPHVNSPYVPLALLRFGKHSFAQTHHRVWGLGVCRKNGGLAFDSCTRYGCRAASWTRSGRWLLVCP